MISCALTDNFFSEYFLAELVIGNAGRKPRLSVAWLKPRHKESVLGLTVLAAA